MPIITAVISVLVLTGFFALFNSQVIKRSRLGKKFDICPLCLAVSGTWFLILFGIVQGYLEANEWRIVAAILMGSSVSGIAYQAERKFGLAKLRGLLFKTIILVAGFLLVYVVIQNINAWTVFFVGIALIIFGYFLFFRRELLKDWLVEHKKEPSEVSELEEKLKNCC